MTTQPEGFAGRRRGVYVPTDEAQALLELAGWVLIDDCPGGDEVLLAPPEEEAAA